jgi:hypothetical protein
MATMTATALLNLQLLTMAQRGDRPRVADPMTHNMWTSDDQHDREIAAAWCQGGVVIVECGDAAEERAEKWGVWSGIDRSIIR